MEQQKLYKWYLTFPVNHPLANGWVEVEAPSWGEARMLVVEHFGAKWSFLRDEQEHNSSYFPLGKLGSTLR